MSGDLLFTYAKVFRIGDGGATSGFWSRERATQIGGFLQGMLTMHIATYVYGMP